MMSEKLQESSVNQAPGRPGARDHLRVCFIVESGTDVRLVEGLAERFEVTVLARRILDGVEISQPTARPGPVVLGSPSRGAFAAFVWNYLRRNRGRYDIVLVQGYSLAALAANLARQLTGTPTFMLVCSPVEAYYRCRRLCPDLEKPFRRSELFALRAVARANAFLGTHYIVLSHHLAGVVRGHGARGSVDIIPVYGVDTELFTPATEPRVALKARLALPETGSLLFFSSRMAPEKDAGTLLAAVRRLRDAGQDLWLLHRSGGYQAFVECAKRLGVAERVIAGDAFHPHRELPQYYQACDLCVQASREEGLGFSPLEALACGVPVAAAAVGGLQETVVDGQTGWTYPAGDSEALARCIKAALEDSVEAGRRAAAGRELVCRQYDRRLVFRQLESVFMASVGR
jgi:glycosyltransferase involved in cell wall biosynthesis